MRYVLLFLSAFFLLSCSPKVTKVTPELEKFYKSNIIGVWHYTIEEDNMRISSEKTFRSDGSAYGTLFPEYYLGKNWIKGSKVTFTSKWKIEGSTIKVYEMRSNPVGFLDPTDVHNDKILSMTKDTINYFSGQTISIMKRGKFTAWD